MRVYVIVSFCNLSIFTSAREDNIYVFVVCLSVSNFAQKLPNGFARNFPGRLAMGHWTNG